MTLIEKMKEKSFSSAESQVVDYLLENKHLIADMTLEELAKATYTSNATVIRLCRKLGYDGYRSFKLAFVMEQQMAKYNVQTVDFTTPFRELNNRDEVLNSLASLYKETIDILVREINILDLVALAKAMNNARRIYIFALGDSLITAKAFVNKLIKLDMYPIIAGDNGEELSHGFNAKNDDLVLFVSYGLGTAAYRSVYQEFKKNGIDMAVITANTKSIITKNAKYKVIIEDYENDDNIATFYSQLSFEFILNYLYSLLFSMNYNKNNARKSVIAKLRAKEQNMS